jgi:hypothetical protein
MLSGLGCIELIAHYYADIYDADKRGLIIVIVLLSLTLMSVIFSYAESELSFVCVYVCLLMKRGMIVLS